MEEPFTAGQSSDVISKLNELAGEETPASVEYEGHRYVRVNRVWYKCADGVSLYTDGVKLPHDQITGKTMDVYTWKLEEGKKVNKSGVLFQ